MKCLTRVLTASGLALLPVLAPAVARADDARLGLSDDGVHFTDALTRPLFDTDLRWVPGDVRTSTFYVRNQSTDAGDLDLSLVRGSEQGDLFAADALVVDARADTGAWTPVQSGQSSQVVDLAEVAPGTVIPVQVRVRMPASAPNDTMILAADLGFRVRLTDATAVLDDSGTIGDGGSVGNGGSGNDGSIPGTDDVDETTAGAGSLPSTGLELPRGLAWLGLVLTGAGAFLVARSRTDRVRHIERKVERDG